MRDMDSETSKKILLFLLLLTLLVDATLLLLDINQYQLVFDVSGWRFSIIFNIVMLALMLLISRKRIIWLPLIILILTLFVYRIGFLFMEWEYDVVDSPKGTETLLIKYRVATLGESHFSYEFYQMSSPFLMKKLTDQDVGFIVYDRVSYSDAKEVLGFDRPDWLNEKVVIFESQNGPKKIRLK